MPLPKRLERMNALLQEHISQYLLTSAELPSGALVTITRVAVAPDLATAKVYTSVMPEELCGSVLQALRRASGRMVRQLFTKLSFRTVPTIEFVIDESEAQAAEVERLMDTLA